MRVLLVLLVVVCAGSTSGCYVASISGLTDASSTIFDENLLGSWRDAEDEVGLDVTRDEWRTYAIIYRDDTSEYRGTARLTMLGRRQRAVRRGDPDAYDYYGY